MEWAQWAHRKPARRARAQDQSNKPPARCGSTCLAIAAAEPASCGPLAGPAAAKGACAGRKRLTYASRLAWPTAGACAFPEKETPEPWALRRAIYNCSWLGGRIRF